jgi:hypothetical protein
VRRVVLVAALAAALAAPALARAGAPPIARPDPATYPLKLDYETTLPGTNGRPATLAALDRAVIMAAVTDKAFLEFERGDDLGGFVMAPLGGSALFGGGRNLLAPGPQKSQIPLFAQAAGGEIASFTYPGTNPLTPGAKPDNGRQPVPPIGPPPPILSPGENTVPPANQGFGGKTGRGGGTTTLPKPPPTTTTPTTTSTSSTTTLTTPTTTATGTTTVSTTTGGGSAAAGGGGAAGACGVAGIQIDSSPPGCVLSIGTASPGDSVSETMTIENTSGSPYDLMLKVEGPQNSHLWQDLQMAAWILPGPAPAILPPLTSWVSGFNSLTTLNPGQSVQVEIELYLPTTAGNADQGKTAVITFHWRAG